MSPEVREFRDSPFAREPDKYSQFVTWGPHQIYEDCHFKGANSSIGLGRIWTFFYQATSSLVVEPCCILFPYEEAGGGQLILRCSPTVVRVR